MGPILASLTASQRSYLNAMVGQGMTSWPNLGDQIDKRPLTNDEYVAVTTYAGDMFSWYAGNVDADVYFCPERQGTYFGSFYLKDAPAMGNPNYSIPTNLTGDMGAAFLGVLTPSQRSLITNLVNLQSEDLLKIVDRRHDVATELREFIAGQTPDLTNVLDLMNKYGEHDGEIIDLYATAFADVAKTLSSDQWAQLSALRTEILQGEPSVPAGAYLYSTPIGMPSVPNSDFLFVPEPGSLALAAVGGLALLVWRRKTIHHGMLRAGILTLGTRPFHNVRRFAMKLMVLALAIGLSAVVLRAQDPDGRPPRDGERPEAGQKDEGNPPPRDGDRPGAPPREDSQPLTAEQKARVKDILSKYDPSSLTAKDARAINDAFRAAGLRNGPGLQDAIREAGFKPERIGELDPPPDRPADARRPDDRRPEGGRRDRRGDDRGPPDRRGPGQGGGYSIEQAISDRRN